MKRSSVLKVLVLAMFLSVLIIPFQGHAQEKVITLKVANWFPVAHKQTPLLESWGKDLEKRTNGKSEGQLLSGRYPGSSTTEL